MANYELLIKKSVARDLRALPKQAVTQIMRRIKALAVDLRPAGCEKLSGQERYRVRQEGYRILYEIRNSVLIVVVVKVGHRRDVYRARR